MRMYLHILYKSSTYQFQHQEFHSGRPHFGHQDDLNDMEESNNHSEDRRSASRSSKNLAVLEKTQKISLDELRTNHDAQARALSTTYSNSEMQADGGMPFLAQLWLVFAGVLDCWMLGTNIRAENNFGGSQRVIFRPDSLLILRCYLFLGTSQFR